MQLYIAIYKYIISTQKKRKLRCLEDAPKEKIKKQTKKICSFLGVDQTGKLFF